MSLAGFLGSRQGSHPLLVALHSIIMQDGQAVRNEDVQTNPDLLPNQHPWSEEAGKRLKRLRESLGKSQDDLGVSRGTVSLLERGRTAPERETLRLIASALGVAVASLLPLDSGEGRAYRQGADAALEDVQAMLSDLRRNLAQGEDGGFGFRAWRDRGGGPIEGEGTEGTG